MFVEEDILVNVMSTATGGKKIYLYPNALAEQMPPLIKEKYLASSYFFFSLSFFFYDQIFGLSFSTSIFRVCETNHAETAPQHF